MLLSLREVESVCGVSQSAMGDSDGCRSSRASDG